MPKSVQWLIAFLCIGLYFFIGTCLSQDDFLLYFSSYSLLFGLYFFLLKNVNRIDISFWIAASFIIRFILIFTLPHLSDDFYRFFWDAGLFEQGINPYALKPSEIDLKTLPKALQNIYSNLNSPNYFSVYPPFLQYLFRSAYWLSDGSLYGFTIMIKSLGFFAEILTISVLYFLGKSYEKSKVWSLTYAINPFILIELMGNMHPEIFILPLILFSTIGINKKIWSWGLGWAGAIAIKINPLLYAPLFAVENFCWKRFIILTGSICLAFVSFYEIWANGLSYNFIDSLKLYYQTFEFNGSIYLILRSIGYWIWGYNNIILIGPILFVLATIAILGISIYSWYNDQLVEIKGLSRAMAICWFIYLLTSSIVHPWYISVLVPLAIISGLRFPLVWSYLIGLSYMHYSNENGLPLWATFFQYGIVLIVFLIDIKKARTRDLNTGFGF